MSRRMIRPGAVLVMLLGALSGCVEDDPDYCDGRTPCDGARVCNLAERTCYPAGTDLAMALDGSSPDLAMPVGCTESAQCGPAAPLCEGRKCGPCTASADGGTAPVCAMFHPTRPYCSPRGACVECLAPADCAKQQKTCDQETLTCTACTANAQCSSGLCHKGACVPAAEIFYVDNRGTAAPDCRQAHTQVDGSSPITAFCDVSDALAARPLRPFIRVAASKQPYGALALTGLPIGSVTLVAETRLGATLLATIGVAFSVTGQTSAVDVTLDGLRVAATLDATYAVVCKGKPAAVNLTVTNADLSGGDQVLQSASCNLVVDSTLVHGGAFGGISLDGSDKYAITNSFIFDNASNMKGQGVVLGASATGVFAWNTVANNGGKAQVTGGVQCNDASQLIEASIVAGNAQRNSSQLNGCPLADVITGPDGATGADTADPRFAPCNHPLAVNVGYCVAPGSPAIDRIKRAGDGGLGGDGGIRPLADHDYFGARRPAGGGFDVGAQEQ